MRSPLFRLLAGLATALAAAAWAQQAPAPAPQFAESNLNEKGVRSLAANCAACHGTNGRTVSGSPVRALAGMSRDEMVQAMGQFKSGARPATLMHQIAKGYSDAEIAALGDYFAKQSR